MNLKQLLSLKLSQGKVASCVTCKSTVHFIKEFYAIENYGLKFFWQESLLGDNLVFDLYHLNSHTFLAF